MKKSLIFGVALLLSTLTAGTALAQSDAGAAANPEPSAYITLDLKAGFVLDPFLVSVNGGGEVDASTLDEACVGFINDAPVMKVNWEGTADFIDIFFYSDTDPTLVVQLPDGSYVCADDANENLLDPELTVEKPAAGEYKIWVGSFDEGHLLPGLLVITAKRDFTLSNFDPGVLVRRGQLPQEDIQPPVAEEAVAAQLSISTTVVITPDGSLAADSDPLTATVVATGTLPAFLLGSEDVVCSGLVTKRPDYIVKAEDGLENLRIFFEGDDDATLVVANQQLGMVCGDDAAAGANSNPLIDIPKPPAGLYGIWVGRLGEETPVTGTLTISAGADLQPETLKPAVAPQN